MATRFVQIENDVEIQRRLDAERMRLRKIAGLTGPLTSTAGGTPFYGGGAQ